MHIVRHLASYLAVIALALTGSLTAIHPALAASPVVGHVYVNDNSLANAVTGFARHLDGSLSPITGSPFDAGGSGGANVASQGAIQFSNDGRYVLAVDTASNQVSVLRLSPDGALRLVGSPVSSGGTTPVSIAVNGNLVYVANQGGTPNVTGFTLRPDGTLQPVSGSTVSLITGTDLTDVLFNRTGRILVAVLTGQATGTQPIDGQIASFTVGADGRLTPASTSPITAQANGPFGSAFRPTNPAQLFVSNAHAGGGNGTVSVYTVDRGGNLSPLTGSPYANDQTAPCWVAITHDGRDLFAVNTGTGSVSSFGIAPDGRLTLVGSTSAFAAGLGALDAGVDQSNSFLYVVERGGSAVEGLRINRDGSLTVLGSTALGAPSGSAPFGIAVN